MDKEVFLFRFQNAANELGNFSGDELIDVLNSAREMILEYSPFKEEPVDCVRWVKHENVEANDYNPNSVAPPEMELLRLSINNDGYTQPVVGWPQDDGYQVVDGFHRTRVVKECKDINERVHGYIPIVSIKDSQKGKSDRMASTIRHNRARGKHNVTAMSDIVMELKNRNWKNARIAKELGMDEDEVLRLCQITGLESLFEDNDFSNSWESADSVEINNFEQLTDGFEDDSDKGRTANTSDPNRIFHTFDKWECVGYNFYGTTKPGMSKDQCEQEYFKLLSDIPLFEATMEKIISEWKHSCEHYLTNTAMNRIAWLGQASLAYHHRIPCKFCGGFNLLSHEQQSSANEAALKFLNKWLDVNGMEEVEMDRALSLGRQVEIY